MSQKVLNMNHVHSCESALLPKKDYASSITECNFTLSELKAIYDFYIARPPLKKSKDQKADNLRFLGDYGWAGVAQLNTLERNLLRKSNICSFIIMKSDSIEMTLAEMKLKDEVCPDHPRAVMQLNKKISVQEDGVIRIEPSESRMACLFRHLRNGIAHGLLYKFPNENILIEDRDDTSNKSTASILIKSSTLVDWIKEVDLHQEYFSYLFEKTTD